VNSVGAAVTERVRAAHPGAAIDFLVFETSIADSLRREKALAVLSGFFAVLASALAAIGLYGIVAYVSISRRNEVSIRMALGSTRAGIVRLLMLDAAGPIAIGMIAGLAGSLAFARTLRSLIFGASPYDPLVYSTAAAVLAAVAGLGSYLPARRASRAGSLATLNAE
jgi:putative ABC transport system permease protein